MRINNFISTHRKMAIAPWNRHIDLNGSTETRLLYKLNSHSQVAEGLSHHWSCATEILSGSWISGSLWGGGEWWLKASFSCLFCRTSLCSRDRFRSWWKFLSWGSCRLSCYFLMYYSRCHNITCAWVSVLFFYVTWVSSICMLMTVLVFISKILWYYHNFISEDRKYDTV